MDHEVIQHVVNNTDFVTIACLGCMLYFYNKSINRRFEKIDEKFERLEKKFEDEIRKLSDRITVMENRLSEIDKRLAVIETIIHMKDGCLFRESNESKKAE